MLATARVFLAVAGVLAIVGGLLAIGIGQVLSGLYAFVVGAVLLFVVVYERGRYRSIDADRRHDTAGPGGGEPAGVLPASFRATDEVFIDPTSGRRMRVYLEAATGNRRYIAED